MERIYWNLFEKTGNIDAYLLYLDIKKMSDLKGAEIKTGKDSGSVEIN